MDIENLTEEQRQALQRGAQSAYMREYRKKNKKRVKKNQDNFWIRRGLELLEKGELEIN